MPDDPRTEAADQRRQLLANGAPFIEFIDPHIGYHQFLILSLERVHQRFGDPRPAVRVVGDESGVLGGTDGSPWYLVATATLRDARLGRRLAELRGDLHRRGAGASIGSPFHAKSDRPRTRQQVLTAIASADVEVDITAVDKRRLRAELREEPLGIYRLLWFHHLLNVLPTLFLEDAVVHLSIAHLNDAKVDQEFLSAYHLASGAALAPFLARYRQRHAIPEEVRTDGFSGVPLRGLPAVLFGQDSPQRNRLLQVGDYVAWCAHRRLRDPADEFFAMLEHRIRSFRVLDVRDGAIPRSAPVRSPEGQDRRLMLTPHELAVAPSFVVPGHPSSHQAQLAYRQRLAARDPVGADAVVAHIDPERLSDHEVSLLEDAIDVRRQAGWPPAPLRLIIGLMARRIAGQPPTAPHRWLRHTSSPRCTASSTVRRRPRCWRASG